MNKIKTISSYVKYSNIEAKTINQLLSEIKNIVKNNDAFIYAQSDNGITIDRLDNWKNHEIKGIRKIRVFHNNLELYAWRISSKEFKTRFRIDGEGLKTMYYDTHMLIFGDDKQVGKESSGREIILPKNKRNCKYIVIRNYVDYNEINQIGIIDYRIIGFDEERRDKNV